MKCAGCHDVSNISRKFKLEILGMYASEFGCVFKNFLFHLSHNISPFTENKNVLKCGIEVTVLTASRPKGKEVAKTEKHIELAKALIGFVTSPLIAFILLASLAGTIITVLIKKHS